MKRGKLVVMSEYRDGLAGGSSSGGQSETKPVPDVSTLWELLDRNLNIDIWKKGK